MPNKIKLHKKAQETLGKHVLFWAIVAILVAIAMAVLILQARDVQYAWIDKIFG